MGLDGALWWVCEMVGIFFLPSFIIFTSMTAFFSLRALRSIASCSSCVWPCCLSTGGLVGILFPHSVHKGISFWSARKKWITFNIKKLNINTYRALKLSYDYLNSKYELTMSTVGTDKMSMTLAASHNNKWLWCWVN